MVVTRRPSNYNITLLSVQHVIVACLEAPKSPREDTIYTQDVRDQEIWSALTNYFNPFLGAGSPELLQDLASNCAHCTRKVIGRSERASGKGLSAGIKMWITGKTGLFGNICGRAGRSGFGCASTAEEVTEGLDATGLTAIVTGGASGLGAETSRVLALRGAHVIIAARNLRAAQNVKDDILKQAAGAEIDLIELDLNSLASVKTFVDTFLATGYPLNILINNAGVMVPPFQLSADGIESQFGTNHLAHFYLTQLLLDKMKSSAKTSGLEGRIVILSSSAHNVPYKGGFKFDKINERKGYDPLLAYGQSKLANILHANELARRLQEEGVNITANSVHPGYIKTNLFRHAATTTWILSSLLFYLWKDIPQGAATTLYVALRPELKGVSGKYFADCNEEQPSKLGVDQELAKKLWDFSEHLILEKTKTARS